MHGNDKISEWTRTYVVRIINSIRSPASKASPLNSRFESGMKNLCSPACQPAYLTRSQLAMQGSERASDGSIIGADLHLNGLLNRRRRRSTGGRWHQRQATDVAAILYPPMYVRLTSLRCLHRSLDCLPACHTHARKWRRIMERWNERKDDRASPT